MRAWKTRTTCRHRAWYAAEIVEDLQAALAEFTELAESLQGIGVEIDDEVEL